MPIFEKREEFLATKEVAMGGTVNFEITRAFHIEQILLKVEIDTEAAELRTGVRLGDILKSVRMSTADGSNVRTVVNASGGDLIELALQEAAIDYNTLAWHYTEPQAPVVLYIPINFVPQQTQDPIKSAMLLPATRFNQNPILEISLMSVSEAFSAGGTGASVKITPLIVRRVVTAEDWVTFDVEIKANEVPLPQSTYNRYRYELDVPGSYTGILLRTWASAGARGNIQNANGRISLAALNTSFRETRLEIMARQNAQSYALPFGLTNTVTPESKGEYFFDFLTDQIGSPVHDLSSVLDANFYAGTGAKVAIDMDIDGGTNAKMRIVTRRIFGTLNALKIRKT